MSDGSEGFYFEDKDGNRIFPKGAHLGNLDFGDAPYLLENPKDGTVYDLSKIGGGSSTDTRTDVSDDGTGIVTDVEDINLASYIAVADDGDGTVTVNFAEISHLVNHPERPPIAALGDTESIEIPIRVPDGKTLEVYRWGAFDVSDGTAPTGLTAELLDDGDTVQASENTPNTQSTSSTVASYANSSGSASIFKLRAYNGTGGAINSPGVGCIFGYRVV